jgi:D-cysteine desulfhydrase
MTGTADRATRHLFRRYPKLAGQLPWMPLVDLPTPVQRLDNLCACVGGAEFWIKRDDLDSKIYSGNKPRKFEFIFAEALAKRRTAVLTLGSAGSNHGAATSLYCRHLGLRPLLALTPQPVLSYVRENILVDHACGAGFLPTRNDAGAVWRMLTCYLRARLTGQTPPYVMYFGGSSLMGNVGFVEAGLELAAQVEAGEMPAPRYLFVTTGSSGTHAGLLVGLRAAGLGTQVVGVSIVSRTLANRHVVAFHANRVARHLRRLDPSFPAVHISPREVNLLHEFFGGEYGRPTPECKQAIQTLRETENLTLDPTYTGKSFAGMLAFVRQHDLRGQPVLYWQTLNTVPLKDLVPAAVPDDLPAPLRAYFEQPLYDPEL